jgi:hypothetical protein
MTALPDYSISKYRPRLSSFEINNERQLYTSPVFYLLKRDQSHCLLIRRRPSIFMNVAMWECLGNCISVSGKV